MRTLPLALTLALIGAGGWQDRQLPTFRTGVDLVQVDVVVVDQDGNPVNGLKAADFAVTDRGKPQLIATFDEVTHRRSDAGPAIVPPPGVMLDVASNQTAPSDRLVVMVIDDLHIWKERTEKAKEIARKVLADLGPQSSMSVLFTSQEHSTQVTTDQSRLRAAIETLRGRQSWRRPHQAMDTQTGARIDGADSMDAALAKVQNSQDTKVQEFFDNLTQYKTLRDAARLLGQGDSRRKAFVLVSEGIGKDLTGLFGAMAPPGEAPGGGTAYASGDVAALASHGTNPYHDEALIDMMEAMRRANVATYAIDPRGKVASADLSRECFPAPSTALDPCSNDMAEWHSVVRLSQHGLEIASAASGGFAVTNTDDFTSGITRIVEDLDHYYLLGFYPVDTKGKGYRPIDVKVIGHPGLRLRFRHGYMPGAAPAAPKNSNPMLALAAGILPKTDLPLRLGAVVLPGLENSRIVLALEVSAPRRLLESADGRLRDRLKYEVLVVDQKKSKVRSMMGLEAELTLSRSGRGDNPPDMLEYQVGETIELAPGRYELRVSAVSTKLGKGGSVYLELLVPEVTAPLSIGGLAIGLAAGSPIAVAPPTSRVGRGPAVAAAMPLPFAPTLARAFAASDELRVYFEGLVAGSRVTAAIDVLDAGGKVVRSPSPSFMTGDRVKVQSVIPLAGLAPGVYVLRGTLGDGVRATSTQTAFAIR